MTPIAGGAEDLVAGVRPGGGYDARAVIRCIEELIQLPKCHFPAGVARSVARHGGHPGLV
jgi:hypothetical protein